MDALKWRTSDESLLAYRDSLYMFSGQPPVIFPFRALWKYGGFARVVTPGILIAVVGLWGGLKTAFIECICDAWRMMEMQDVLWWGTEWTWEQMSDRAVQRYGGISLEEKTLHNLWLYEEQNHIALNKRQGRQQSNEALKRTESVITMLQGWPGLSHMLEETITDIDQLLEASKQRIEEQRRVGRHVRFVVWDYMQLLDLYSARSENERLSLIMGKMQVFCFKEQVIGIVASQVTKVASAAARGKEREPLNAESGQNFRADKPKLVLTLKPIFQGGLMTDTGIINVEKNNTGRTGEETVRIDPAHFKWIDTKEEPRPKQMGISHELE